MRALVERVLEAKVEDREQLRGSIGKGLLVFLAVEVGDTEADGDYLTRKVLNLRVLETKEAGTGRLSVLQADQAEILLVSQFSLMASFQKGFKPSFHRAERPEMARKLWQYCLLQLQGSLQHRLSHGVFGAHMKVGATHDGPFNFMLDSRGLSR